MNPSKPLEPIDSDHAAPMDLTQPSRARARTKSRRILVIALLAIAAVVAVSARLLRPKPPLPTLGQMPAFSLVDSTNAPFNQGNLKGSVWVADFIFTHCTQTCPRLTARMAELQGHVAAASEKRGSPLRVKLVSFSVDPDNDTPEVLAGYGAKNGADPRVWSFVTGPNDKVKTVIVDGFKMTADRIEKGAGEYDVMHGNWFVLGDGEGKIRGYYEVKTTEEVELVARDVVRLEGETK